MKEDFTTTGEVTEATTRLNDAPDTSFTRFNFLSLLSLFIFRTRGSARFSLGRGEDRKFTESYLYLVQVFVVESLSLNVCKKK